MIYIIANAKVTSGGPELLHQFCSELIKCGVEASMVYFDRLQFPAKNTSEAIKNRYGRYNCPISHVIKDTADNIIVFPETVLWLLPKFKKMKKVIWWLSVDNYYPSLHSKYAKVYAPLGMNREKYNPFHKSIVHCYQSEYAKQFLMKHGVRNLLPLSDYLSDEFIKASKDEQSYNKENIVLYNPKKGLEYTKKIMQACSDIQWVALQDLTHNEMCELMKRSKVYVDFGNHPGKDRIPREAVMCGCCVITGLKGSAENLIDIPIDFKFKKSEKDENIAEIIDLIKECIKNYDDIRMCFEIYRNEIRKEYQVFHDETKKFMSAMKIRKND